MTTSSEAQTWMEHSNRVKRSKKVHRCWQQVGCFTKVPIIEKDFGEEAGQDAEVADGEDVDVDHMGQRVDHCQEEKQQ